MLQVFGTIISLIIGFFVWSFTLLLSKGAYPFGSIGGFGAFVFFTPIACLILPVAIRSFNDKSPAQGMFLLAIAPIIGVLNFIPLFLGAFIIMKIFGKSSNDIYYSGIFFQLIWACILWVNLKVADNRPTLENRPPTSQEPCKVKDYSGIVQVIGLAAVCLVAYFFLKR